jgi:iron(II)-dependent oxidoreductase
VTSAPDAPRLVEWLRDARRRTIALVADLDDTQLLGPKLRIVNPPLWEIGHVGWFAERWVLRHALSRSPLRSDGDALYDSSAVAHDTRWSLPLPSRGKTIDYLAEVQERIIAALLSGDLDEKLRYFAQLVVFHEDMHGEALLYTRQTHGWPAPPLPPVDEKPAPEAIVGDLTVPGGIYRIGAENDQGFVFDNEKWAHPVELAPFAIARRPVTDGELAEFVGDGGYRREELWSADGWRWRNEAAATHPLHWRRGTRGWERRRFDRFVELDRSRAAIHVNWYEAEAFCNWAGRRLPSESELEVAARTNAIDQATGSVWQWTADDFLPYPSFVADPYKEYSEPWFGTHKVLRGGCFATRPRLLRDTWRNFYTPDRRDVFSGFRTCAR